MDEDEEINIVSDPNFLNCDYTVHPQWLLDRPSTNPDCWYNNASNKSREDSDQDPIGHITTENSITDESGWTEKEKTLLERGLEIFGKSPLRLSQFIGTKTPSEIKYYFKSFYMELHHPTHFVRNSVRKLSDDFIDLGNVLIDSQIPCTSEQIVGDVIRNDKRVNKRKISPKEVVVKNKIKTPLEKQCKIYNKYNILPSKQIQISNKNKKVNRSINNMELVEDTSSSIKKLISKSNLIEGEIVYMKKTLENSDSDVEIDVEEDDCDDVRTAEQNRADENVLTECSASGECSGNLTNVENVLEDDENILNQLSSLDIPRFEVKLDKNSVSSLEKFIFSELFPQNEKSSENYLELRNHIILTWNCKKPNYLTKGDIQKGFKSSVRSTLCKIHNYLEQIGVINYGCGRVRYIRPMQKVFKNVSMQNLLKSPSHPRRFKKRFLHNGEGGCTVSHGAHGEIIETTVINEDPVLPKLKTLKKQPTYLIYCKPFSCEYKYKVKLHLSTLLLMDFHAHSSLSEVMGLVGGSWSPSTKSLSINHYEPCKNLASSTTHCDMCPVSQAASAESINDMGLNLLGWFHSHPTFAPEPSQQDLDTQRGLQEWIGNQKPCVGIILSPFNRPTALTPSEYRCLIVDKLQGDNTFLPYKFKVEIVSDNFDLGSFMSNIERIHNFVVLNRDFQDEKLRISFKQPYIHDKSLTFLEKFVSSARLTLERYFSEQVCQQIVESFAYLCNDK